MSEPSSAHPQIPCAPGEERRSFFKKVLATILGALAGIIPAGAGLTMILDPLRRKGSLADATKVTSLDAIPNDGVPRKFSIVASRTDVWNKTPNVPIGAVYIRRTGEKQLEVLNVSCPHAGCFVDYTAEKKGFFCPCHNSLFGADGSIADAKSPSPRALDTLTWEIRGNNEVWVKFQNFRAGHKEKIPAT